MRTQDHRVLITDTNLIPGHTYEIVVAARTRDGRLQAFEESPRTLVTLAGKADLPAAPTALATEASFQNIFLTWTRPGDPDIDAIEVYRYTSDDRESAVKIGETKADSFVDNIGAPNLTRYYWLRSRNRTGTQSDWNASAGVSATTAEVTATDIEDFAITATKLNVGTVVLEGVVWSNNTPSGVFLSWNQHTIVYAGVSYTISAGATADAYICWIAGATSYTTASSHPAVGNTSFIIAYNRSGVAEQVWNSSANMVIGTAWIENAAITNAKIGLLAVDTGNIAALAVTDAKIATLGVGKLTAGTISSKAITLAVAAGTGDVSIAAGKTDFDNTQAGFILGCDDSDGDKAKLYIGDSTQYLNWNGADLTVQGIIQTAPSGYRMVMDSDSNHLSGYNIYDTQTVDLDGDAAGSLWIGDSTNTRSFLYNNSLELKTAEAVTAAAQLYLNNDYASQLHLLYIDSVTLSGAAFLIEAYVNSAEKLSVTKAGYLKVAGGVETVSSGFYYNGTKVVGAQGAAIANATDATTTMARLNDLLAACRTHGLIAT